MGASTTMTIRVTPDLKDRLGRLAQDTRRSRSYLAAEAVAAYVARELAIIDGIQRGLDDMEADRVTSHAEVTATARRIVDEARQRQAAHHETRHLVEFGQGRLFRGPAPYRPG